MALSASSRELPFSHDAAAGSEALDSRPYADGMLERDAIDVEEIATALADQTDYEHRWLIDPRTGEVVFWTSDLSLIHISEPTRPY